MTAIRQIIFSSILVIFIAGCIEPNIEDLWSITIEGMLQIDGFARDVAIENNTAYIASGQAGIQVWDLVSLSQSGDFTGYFEIESFLEFEDLSIIGRDSINNLVFASESNEDVKIFHYITGDTDLTYMNTIMSAKTKDFISFSSEVGKFVMFSADNDDGLKWSIYEPYEFWGNTVWNPVYPEGGDGELYTPGKPQGIDSDGESFIALAVDQLGVELYSIDSIGADPEFVGRVDTEGNAEKLVLSQLGVYVACDDAGAYFIHIETFSGTGTSTRFAEDLTVDHIAVNGNVAALSIGPKGIALFDVTDPSKPVEKGIFDVGYVYKTKFWGEKLLVCSREGLQIITIEQ